MDCSFARSAVQGGIPPRRADRTPGPARAGAFLAWQETHRSTTCGVLYFSPAVAWACPAPRTLFQGTCGSVAEGRPLVPRLSFRVVLRIAWQFLPPRAGLLRLPGHLVEANQAFGRLGQPAQGG